MKFSDFIKRKEVRKTEFDPELFKSLVKTAELDMIFLETVKINEYSSKKIINSIPFLSESIEL